MSAGGTSAGGKLAINIAQMAHSSGQFELRALALGCAVVDATRTDRSSPKPNPMVNTRLQKLTVESYFPDATRRREPLASPFYDPNLAAALPPTLIMTGALDTLAPEMDDLATRLTQQGVPVTYRRYDNVDHGFSHFKPIETARDSIALTGEFLLETLR